MHSPHSHNLTLTAVLLLTFTHKEERLARVNTTENVAAMRDSQTDRQTETNRKACRRTNASIDTSVCIVYNRHWQRNRAVKINHAHRNTLIPE